MISICSPEKNIGSNDNRSDEQDDHMATNRHNFFVHFVNWICFIVPMTLRKFARGYEVRWFQNGASGVCSRCFLSYSLICLLDQGIGPFAGGKGQCGSVFMLSCFVSPRNIGIEEMYSRLCNPQSMYRILDMNKGALHDKLT